MAAPLEHHAVDPRRKKCRTRARPRSSRSKGTCVAGEVDFAAPGQALTSRARSLDLHFRPRTGLALRRREHGCNERGLGRSENGAADSARALFDALRLRARKPGPRRHSLHDSILRKPRICACVLRRRATLKPGSAMLAAARPGTSTTLFSIRPGARTIGGSVALPRRARLVRRRQTDAGGMDQLRGTPSQRSRVERVLRPRCRRPGGDSCRARSKTSVGSLAESSRPKRPELLE